MSLSRPIAGRALRHGALTVLALAGGARASAAQRAPGLLVSLGGGSVPRDDGAADQRRVAGLTAALGLRAPVWRWLYVEGLVQGQASLDLNDDLTLIPLPSTPGTFRYRTLETSRDAASNVALLARAGAELFGSGRQPTVRFAAGAGALPHTSGPLATLSGGISSPGRRLRLTLDADGWWYRVRATEVVTTMPDGGGAAQISGRPVRVRLRSTFLRLGIEVPVGARGR